MEPQANPGTPRLGICSSSDRAINAPSVLYHRPSLYTPRGFRIPNYTTNVSEGKEQTKQEALERDPKIAGGGPAEYSPHVHPHPGRVICHGRHSSGR